jgi:hypothetical protein
MLDPVLWANLEARGLSQDHLELLLSLLQVERPGHLKMDFVHGHIHQVNANIVVPNKHLPLSELREAVTCFMEEASPQV